MEKWSQCYRALQQYGVAVFLFPPVVTLLLAQVNKARNRQSASALRNTAARYVYVAMAMFRWLRYLFWPPLSHRPFSLPCL